MPTIVVNLRDLASRSRPNAIHQADYLEACAMLDACPDLYAQQKHGDQAQVMAHIVCGESHWWVTEIGRGEERDFAYGYVMLNGWHDCAETGPFSLSEIFALGASVDTTWQPKTLAEVKQQARTLVGA